MPFTEALRTLESMSVGKSYAAYELTLLSRLAASVNINSLRGRTFLPHAAGSQKKKEIVLVFAEGEQAEEARSNGADIVGGSELIEDVIVGLRPPGFRANTFPTDFPKSCITHKDHLCPGSAVYPDEIAITAYTGSERSDAVSEAWDSDYRDW